MASASFTVTELANALSSVGIEMGDCVLVHSSLLHLGRLGGCPARDMPGVITETLLEAIGDDGTLATLAPYYDYSDSGAPFDTVRSPVSPEVGVLNAAIAAHPDAERSANPMFSLAAIGKLADHICNGPNASAFGAESAWDRAVHAGAKILLLGSSFERLTLARYIEQKVGVPYLFVKMFRAPVSRNGAPLGQPVTALLRYRHLPLDYGLAEFEARLNQAGITREAPLGGGRVLAMDAAKSTEMGINALQDDIHFFLKSPPDYVDNAFPLS